MEIKDYGRIIWKNKWLILLLIILTVGGTYYYSIRQSPIYRSDALLLVTTPQPTDGSIYQDVLTTERQAQTFAAMIKDGPILETLSPTLAITTKEMERNLDVAPLQDTQLIQVTYTNTSPARSQLILNTICDYFSRYVGDLYYGSSDQQIRSLADTVQKSQADLTSAQREFDSLINPTASQLEIARGKITYFQSLYLNDLSKLEEAQKTQANGTSQVIVYKRATLPDTPISPRIVLNMAAAFLLALFLGIAIAFLRNYLDDTLKTEESVKKYMNDLPVLGAIPVIPKNSKAFMKNDQASLGQNRTKEQSTLSLAVLGNPKSAPAEGFRTLRTNIQFLSAEKPLRSLMFTSSSPSEGKTTISANIAASIAQMGQKVVLVDADLRRPYVHKLFGLSALPGLSNYLVGKAELQMILKKTSVPNLQVICAGALPPLPAELLASTKMQALLQELKTQFEMVILDVPPAIAVTDASLVGKIADGVIVVIACGKTKREQARATIQTLAKAGITPLGVIMNLVDQRKGYGYYYYYYRSYYNRYEKESEKEEHIF